MSKAILQFRSTWRRHGVAMLLVIAVIAVASVMGLAMLSSTTLQGQLTKNSVTSLSADTLAESGMNLAMYYVYNPSSAPSLNSDGYWGGQTGISFGSGFTGSANVTVTRVSGTTSTYDIVAVGSPGSSVTKTLTARIMVNSSFQVLQAAAFNQSFTVDSGITITGSPTAIRCNQTVTRSSGGSISGTVYANSASGVSYTSIGSGAAAVALSQAQVRDYRTYVYNGTTYNATQITSATLSNQTLGTTGSNPKGVYYTNSNLTIDHDVTINGTLVVRNGKKLTLVGDDNTITAATDYPALVVEDEFVLPNTGGELTVNGLVWLGKGVTVAATEEEDDDNNGNNGNGNGNGNGNDDDDNNGNNGNGNGNGNGNNDDDGGNNDDDGNNGNNGNGNGNGNGNDDEDDDNGGGGSSTTVSISGAVLVATGNISTSYTGSLSVTYHATKSNVPNFSTAATSAGLTLKNWSQ